MSNGLGQFLTFGGRLFVPKALVPAVLHEYHDARGHFGVNRITTMIAEWFYWPCMGQAVRAYCAQCDVCQRSKADTRRTAGLYQPLPVP